jgi:pyrimidine operon attenuation protein / uracil phosphoribosyltransferase
MPPEVIEILSADEVRRTLTRLASEIIEQTDDLSKLVLIGISPSASGFFRYHVLSR